MSRDGTMERRNAPARPVAPARVNQNMQRGMRQSFGKPAPQAVKWQPFLTLKGELPGADPVEVVQPASFWLDTTQLNNVVVRTDIARIDANCHIYLETAATPNGPWFEAADLTSPGISETMLMSNSATDLLSGYLRWRYYTTLTTGTPWTVTFKMTVYPVSEPQKSLNLSPRVA